MKWRQVRRLVTGKLGGQISPGSKHDFGWVPCDGKWIGRLKISRGEGDLTAPEVGHCARSIHLSESRFRALEECSLSREEFFRIVTPPGGAE